MVHGRRQIYFAALINLLSFRSLRMWSPSHHGPMCVYVRSYEASMTWQPMLSLNGIYVRLSWIETTLLTSLSSKNISGKKSSYFFWSIQTFYTPRVKLANSNILFIFWHILQFRIMRVFCRVKASLIISNVMDGLVRLNVASLIDLKILLKDKRLPVFRKLWLVVLFPSIDSK